MKRSLPLVILAVAVLIRPTPSLGQDRTLDAHFSVTSTLGAGWSGLTTWVFRSGDEASIRPGIGVGLGLEYGPVAQLDGALFISSIEASFTEERATASFATGQIEGGVQWMPVMLWAKIISDRQLSPFLRFGAGIGKIDFREDAWARRGPTIRFHKWHFVWGLGGGLDYQVIPSIGLELFVEDWITESGVLDVNSEGRTDGLYDRSGMYTFGVRAVFSL